MVSEKFLSSVFGFAKGIAPSRVYSQSVGRQAACFLTHLGGNKKCSKSWNLNTLER